MIRNILSRILSVIVSIIIFVGALILMPTNTKQVNTVELTYIFVDENGNEYNVFEKTHGAATDWSFLFENSDDSESTEIQTGEIVVESNESVTESSEPVISSGETYHFGEYEYTIEGIDLNIYSFDSDKTTTDTHADGDAIITITNNEDAKKFIEGKPDKIIHLDPKDFSIKPEHKEGSYANMLDILFVNLNLNLTKDTLANLLSDEISKTTDEKGYFVEIVVNYKLKKYPSKFHYFRNINTYHLLMSFGYSYADSTIEYKDEVDINKTVSQVVNIAQISKDNSNSEVLLKYDIRLDDENELTPYINNYLLLSEEKYEGSEIDYSKSQGLMFYTIENLDNIEYISFIGAEDSSNKNTGDVTTNTGIGIKTGLQHIDYVGSGNSATGDSTTQSQITQSEHVYKDCITPWSTVVKHGDYVLAYEQRADVQNVCNIQKRTCNDGVLKGTYTQGYCNEKVEYTYTKEKVVTHNDTQPSQLVQNPKYAKNDGAEFNTHGKLVGEGDSPNTIWDNNENNPVELNKGGELEKNEYYNCNSPRGEVITHGQFVKAYESPLGFKDQPCKVELRLCLNGDLQGNYSYSKCEYIDKTYYDYLDENKTIQELFDEATTLHSGFEYDNIEGEISDLASDAESLLDTHSLEGEPTYIKKSFVKEVWDWLVSLFI